MIGKENSRILSELTVQIVDELTAEMTLSEMAEFWGTLDAAVEKEAAEVKKYEAVIKKEKACM